MKISLMDYNTHFHSRVWKYCFEKQMESGRIVPSSCVS